MNYFYEALTRGRWLNFEDQGVCQLSFDSEMLHLSKSFGACEVRQFIWANNSRAPGAALARAAKTVQSGNELHLDDGRHVEVNSSRSCSDIDEGQNE
jgi:hypothetical protein